VPNGAWWGEFFIFLCSYLVFYYVYFLKKKSNLHVLYAKIWSI
jgi:cbb3-type cytochrome oxidase subunit 3